MIKQHRTLSQKTASEKKGEKMRSKIIFIISLLTILSSALLFSACSGDNKRSENSVLYKIFEKSPQNENKDRFLLLPVEGDIRIIVDTDTGVQYLWRKVSYGAGLTALLDTDGKPLLYKDTENESSTDSAALSQ